MSGGPANGGTDGWYDCDNLVNDSIRNTGLTVLPHTTGTGMDAGKMRPARTSGTAAATRTAPTAARTSRASAPSTARPTTARSRGSCARTRSRSGATIMDGPLYRFDEDASDNSRRWPSYWDGRWFLHNHGGASIKHGLLLDPATDQDGGQPIYADSLRNTLSWQGNYMDSKFGPDGALYVQVYAGFFRTNPEAGIYRFDYIGGPDTPDPDPQVTQSAPLRIAFSIGKSGGVSYRWTFGDGRSATAASGTHTYTRAGTYTVTLTVTYADGQKASKSIQVTV